MGLSERSQLLTLLRRPKNGNKVTTHIGNIVGLDYDEIKENIRKQDIKGIS